MGRKWLRGAALCALVALVAVGCGSSRKGSDTGSGTTTTTAGGSASKTFGSLPSPCGKGTPAPSTEVGVTATDITIGYGDDAGYAAAPGLNKEMSDAMKAMIKWCNDQGGINGRQIKGNYYDAKITEVNNAITQACADKIFMLVGEGFALDAAQEQARLGCKLPAFPTYGVSPELANGPLAYFALPNPVDYQSVTEARFYASKFPDKAKKMGSLVANFSATLDTLSKQHSAWTKVGVTFLPSCEQQYSIAGESDWKPFAQKLKECGAQAVSFIGSPYPNFENLLEAASQLDYHPDWLLEGNFYDNDLAKRNTSGLADHIYVRNQNIPFEAADKNPATKQYVDLVTASSGKVAALGLNATSAFLLWATQVKACGATLTRQCVEDKAAAVHDWNGGGLQGTPGADVGNNKPSICEVVMSLQGTKWVQSDPAELGKMDCNAANTQQVTGPVVDRVNLGSDRKSHKYGI